MSDIMNNLPKNTDNNHRREETFMRKKYSVFFIAFAIMLTFGIFCGFTLKQKVFADSENVFKSKSVILTDYNSGTVIAEQNSKQHLPIASMCKIMTLLLTFEQIDKGALNFDENIAVSETAAGMGGSQVFLEAGAMYKTSDLIKSIVVASANDACVAIAETIAGSEDSFVSLMNARAKELGMTDTVFNNCTGLPKPGQYSCAKDVSVMFCELLNHEDYFKYSTIWMDEISHPKGRVTEISNTNKLVRFYNGCDSGKTGYTSEAGHCLAASAVRNGMRLVCVVISSPDSKTRFAEVSSLFNNGFANYTNKLIIDSNTPLEIEVNVKRGVKDSLTVMPEKSFYLFSAKNVQRSIEQDFQPFDEVKAPVRNGDCVGKIVIYENGVEIGSVNVLAAEDIAEKTYFDYIKDIGVNWGLL